MTTPDAHALAELFLALFDALSLFIMTNEFLFSSFMMTQSYVTLFVVLSSFMMTMGYVILSSFMMTQRFVTLLIYEDS